MEPAPSLASTWRLSRNPSALFVVAMQRSFCGMKCCLIRLLSRWQKVASSTSTQPYAHEARGYCGGCLLFDASLRFSLAAVCSAANSPATQHNATCRISPV